MAGLINITAALVFLLLAEGAISALIRRHHVASADPTDNRLMRFKALSEIKLFRRIYEPDISDKEGNLNSGWRCDTHWTDKDDNKDFYLRPCPIQAPRCKGHIAETGTAPPERSPTGDQPTPGPTHPFNTGKEEGVG